MAKYRFGDIVKEVKGKVDRTNNPYEFFVAGDHMDTDELHILRRGTFEGSDVGPAFIRVFKPGQVLYGSRRTYLRKVAVPDFEGVTANTTFVLETKDESVLLQRLLPFVMQSDRFTQYSIKNSKGSTNPYILFSDLADYELELPSILKQKELSDLLWEIDKTRLSYKKLMKVSDELVKSQFIEMFGDPKKNPYSWETVHINEACSIKSGVTLPVEKENEGGEIAYIKVADMNIKGNEKYITTSTKFVSRLTAGNEIFPLGTIVFPKNGAAVATNKKRIIKIPTCADLNTMGVIPKIEIDEQYFYEWFQLLDLSAISHVSAIPQVNAKTMGEQIIMLPPMDLQQQFAELVRQSDKSKFELENTLKELNATYKRIINENLG